MDKVEPYTDLQTALSWILLYSGCGMTNRINISFNGADRPHTFEYPGRDQILRHRDAERCISSKRRTGRSWSAEAPCPGNRMTHTPQNPWTEEIGDVKRLICITLAILGLLFIFPDC